VEERSSRVGTCGQGSSQTGPNQPAAQSQPFRLKLQSPPLRHESHVNSQSSPNVPGRHSAQQPSTRKWNTVAWERLFKRAGQGQKSNFIQCC